MLVLSEVDESSQGLGSYSLGFSTLGIQSRLVRRGAPCWEGDFLPVICRSGNRYPVNVVLLLCLELADQCRGVFRCFTT